MISHVLEHGPAFTLANETKSHVTWRASQVLTEYLRIIPMKFDEDIHPWKRWLLQALEAGKLIWALNSLMSLKGVINGSRYAHSFISDRALECLAKSRIKRRSDCLHLSWFYFCKYTVVFLWKIEITFQIHVGLNVFSFHFVNHVFNPLYLSNISFYFATELSHIHKKRQNSLWSIPFKNEK